MTATTVAPADVRAATRAVYISFIGCGVAILGSVTVGHDSVIGANAVVLEDVPPHSVAVGVPAKVVKTC